MQIPEDQIERVREVANIVEVVGAHVPLTRKGQNHLGLCPFHDEKTPSFTVHEQKQIFHCFGCGEGGNVFSFVMKMEGLSFPEAVRHLAQRFGVHLTVVEGRQAAKSRGEKERVRRVNEMALEFFRKGMFDAMSGSPVANYLVQRGLDAAAIDRFELGWVEDAWDGLTRHLANAGVTRADLTLAGVAVEKDRSRIYDRFRGRLMFPIRGVDGDLVGFGGRVLGDGSPKYLNSPETPLYHKGSVLYGLYPARTGKGRLDRVVVVEGYMDVIACHRHGITWAVASLGTALTEGHVRLLGRYTDRVDLIFDGDKAGRAAARKAVALLAGSSLEVSVVTLPAGEDPDSLLGAQGAEQVAERLAQGVPMMDFLFHDCLDPVRGAPIERRLQAAEPVMEVLERIHDVLRKGHYISRLAEVLGVDEANLRKAFATRRKAPVRGNTEAPERAREMGRIPQGEALLLHMAVQEKLPGGWLWDRVTPMAFTDPRARRVAEVMAAAENDGAGLDGVINRLQPEPGLLALVSGWMSRDITVEGDPAACAEACIGALMRKESEEFGRQLLRDIKDAEARGETERLMALLRQKDALAKTSKQMAAG